MPSMKILLIAGGWSSEREVSLTGARGMQEALLKRGHAVTFFDLLENFDELLETARQNGVIQFRLRSDSVGMMQQSRELMQKYHLNDVFIIPEAEQEGQLNESIARAGAKVEPR